MAQEIAKSTGCLVEEAEQALQAESNVARATKMIAYEMDLRRKRYVPALSRIWSQYAPGAVTTTDYDGTIALVKDLEVELDNEVVLALAYELQAPQLGVFAKLPYIDGWARWSCGDLPAMIKATAAMSHKMKENSAYFGRVYRYVFPYIVSEGQRMLPIDQAVAYWTLLLVPRYPIAERWIAFMTEKNYSVSRDTWNMALVFFEYAQNDPTLADYDENLAWPAIIDDFVDSVREQPA